MTTATIATFPVDGSWLRLDDTCATEYWGERLGHAAGGGAVIYLHGQLGAGKTTFSRGLIRGLGHRGNVKSPTYTLVEPYENLRPPVYHFDLYRLGDPEELEFMGIRDYFLAGNLCLVEWPEKGRGLLANADCDVELRPVNGAREMRIRAVTPRGRAILAALVGSRDKR